MTGEEIRKALNEKDLSFAAIGRALGHSTGTAVSRICHRQATGRITARFIADALDLPIEEVFPEKPEYSDDPKRLKKTQAEAALREKAEAAGLVA
ncbi:MAG: hypothetical protein COW76_20380 [Shewanella sp. CG18_big_fil_WC_8_21_14_2_50_42_11]|uniref:helix-turn-helix domain-containing protein n=1 Tax=Shewanella sp. CG18_big_fil_WC_8_21_14_2_50_42_11 TaxID=1975538 RepID=UPI000C35CADE|nr:helix-turn-helix domain-containing protein [Shewanella sp. CG18_big_fil_WC_8_21_14_2_50_42_11]PIP98521.1 MAG: hypothetical protein COW76_20380 [Shewanella sp. CG18_big_fil_WC_8_21_14_2_50_42_11]